MFCSNCGAKASGNFCSQCGAPLQSVPITPQPVPVTSDPPDWSDIIDYGALLRIPGLREAISRHAAQAEHAMSGEDFLKHCDKALSKFTGGVPISSVALLAQPVYARLGVKTGKTRNRTFADPPGKILFALLCSLARHGQQIRQVQQVQDGCVIEAVLPSDMWSFKGDLVLILRRETAGTYVEAATVIKGQMFDWGKSRRCLDQLFEDLEHPPALI